MVGRSVLISIHPEYVDRIISGEKRLEFRRRWAVMPVSHLVIYSTSPVKKIMAIAVVKEVHSGCKSYLWRLSRNKFGGVTRKTLFDYMAGLDVGFAIEIEDVLVSKSGVNPVAIFGLEFKPPQSFRYVDDSHFNKILVEMKSAI